MTISLSVWRWFSFGWTTWQVPWPPGFSHTLNMFVWRGFSQRCQQTGGVQEPHPPILRCTPYCNTLYTLLHTNTHYIGRVVATHLLSPTPNIMGESSTPPVMTGVSFGDWTWPSEVLSTQEERFRRSLTRLKTQPQPSRLGGLCISVGMVLIFTFMCWTFSPFPTSPWQKGSGLSCLSLFIFLLGTLQKAMKACTFFLYHASS